MLQESRLINHNSGEASPCMQRCFDTKKEPLARAVLFCFRVKNKAYSNCLMYSRSSLEILDFGTVISLPLASARMVTFPKSWLT